MHDAEVRSWSSETKHHVPGPSCRPRSGVAAGDTKWWERDAVQHGDCAFVWKYWTESARITSAGLLGIRHGVHGDDSWKCSEVVKRMLEMK